MASYPNSIKAFPNRQPGETILDTHMDDVDDEVTAIETGLISGLQHDLKPLNNASKLLGSDALRWKQLLIDIGTVSADGTPAGVPGIDVKGVWNNAGVTFTGFRLNMTDTLSAAASLLMDLQIAGVSKMKVDKAGLLTLVAGLTFAGPLLYSTDNAQDVGAAGANRPRNVYVAGFVAIGTNPATAGAVRLASTGAIKSRNAGNLADLDLLSLAAADYVQLAGGAGISVALAQATLATGATAGFPYLSAMAGTPTGTPVGITGYAPVVIDSSNNLLWFYTNGVWRKAAFDIGLHAAVPLAVPRL